MLSPSDLARRVGVGGGLVPFFKCVCVYFVLGGEAAPGAAAVAAKCAPVLCLLAAVLLLPPRPPRAAAPTADDTDYDKENRRYARLVALGLLGSAGGDALLVWPAQLAAGMALFGAAHACYMAAFWARSRRRAGGAGALLLAAAALYCARVAPPPALRALLPGYAALLAGMAWRALATLPAPPRPRRALAAPLGALLFVLSDAILGYSLFSGPVPYKQVLVMSTYYLGQLGIALSALLPPAPAPAAAPPAPAAAAAPATTPAAAAAPPAPAAAAAPPAPAPAAAPPAPAAAAAPATTPAAAAAQ